MAKGSSARERLHIEYAPKIDEVRAAVPELSTEAAALVVADRVRPPGGGPLHEKELLVAHAQIMRGQA